MKDTLRVPNEIGCEVDTPDGRGSLLVMYPKGVVVVLNTIGFKVKTVGKKRTNGGEMHRCYNYDQVSIVKGRYENRN